MVIFELITPQIYCHVFRVDQLMAACPKNQEMIMHGQKWLGTLSDEVNDLAHIWTDYKRYEWIGVIHYSNILNALLEKLPSIRRKFIAIKPEINEIFCLFLFEDQNKDINAILRKI